MIYLKKFNETITPDYLKNLWDECLIWLKNIKRVNDLEHYYEFNVKFYNWAKGYFNDKLMKNVFGAGSKHDLGKASIISREAIEFFEWFPTAFLPTELDVRKAKMGGVYSIPSMTRIMEDKIPYRNLDSYGNDLFYFCFKMFDEKRQSKYVNIKKHIDEYFSHLLKNLKSDFDIGLYRPENYITDNFIFDGLKVKLEYHEEDTTFIAKTLDMLKISAKQVKKHGFSKALKNGIFEINPNVDTSKLSPNLVNGNNVGTGGYYHYTFIDDDGTMDRGRIQSFMLGDYTLELFTHEIGHKFYYEVMSSGQRNEWKDYVESLEKYPEVNVDEDRYFSSKETNEAENRVLKMIHDLQHEADAIDVLDYKKYKDKHGGLSATIHDEYLLSILGKEKYDAYKDPRKTIEYLFKDELEKAKRMLAIRDLSNFDVVNVMIEQTKTKYSTVYHSFSIFKHVNGMLMRRLAQEFIDFMTAYRVPETKKGYKLAPTDYSSKNESEFFAETFTLFCLWDCPYWTSGSSKFTPLDEDVFKSFISITGVRSASHESKKSHDRKREI